MKQRAQENNIKNIWLQEESNLYLTASSATDRASYHQTIQPGSQNTSNYGLYYARSIFYSIAFSRRCVLTLAHYKRLQYHANVFSMIAALGLLCIKQDLPFLLSVSCQGKPNGKYADPAHPCATYCFYCFLQQKHTLTCPSGEYFDKYKSDCFPKCQVPACRDSSCQ